MAPSTALRSPRRCADLDRSAFGSGRNTARGTHVHNEQWPFERAQTQLDYGEWLRRQRRIAEARPLLTAALGTFRRLGARPWIERATAELRAAGIEAADSTAPGAFTRLSPQQQSIVRLAARGLTNREIGEKLFLSPRTVGSHLYRAFPKLGVAARSHLRDVVEGAAPDARAANGDRR